MESVIESVIERMKPLQELNNVNMAVQQLGKNKELVSDGYHTFKELYDFRMVYNAALFNEWSNNNIQVKEYSVKDSESIYREFKEMTPKYNVHKSWKHHDGELCFGGGWFIVVAVLPTGQISNHYEAKYWNLFKVPETEKALFPFDGHTSTDVLERLKSL